MAIHAGRNVGRDIVAQFGDSTVTVLSARPRATWTLADYGARHMVTKSMGDLNWHLRKIGPVDAIIDVSKDPAYPAASVWDSLFLHLRNGGVYAVRQPDRPARADVEFAQRLARAAIAANDAPAAFNSAVSGVNFVDGWTVITKRGNHYLRMRDAHVDRMLPTRRSNATVELLRRMPAGELVSRATVTSHRSGVPIGHLDLVLPYPAMNLRHYTGKVAVAGHSLLYADGVILPESFRHHLARGGLRNSKLVRVDRQFSIVPDRLRPTRTLPGDYYFLDCPFPGHFGHMTTEALSRLWGWREAKERFPDLKAIFHIRWPNERPPTMEKALFRAYGILDEDIVCLDQPVFVESIVGVTPMFHNQVPHYVHPQLRGVWQTISDNLAKPPAKPTPRLFVSRRPSRNRSCRNAPQVEALFAEYGFTIVYPEDWSMPEQAGLFRDAEVVAGFVGSGMFNILYATKLRQLILLGHEAYTARNEYLFAAVLGGAVDYFWSTPDKHHPPGRWSNEAFVSDWEFDFERNEAELRSLLDRL
ncbi:DUF563 domain-containing protein [Microlunatus sp. Gsoil 973]|uniref:glycosyltransferase family 61 protein n=1 Tax=Microlunatus sp. Gsoil 973 TaxID=2672569 RepID=UPI0018A86B0C|nr:glycosyltransferase 61 family protein [Microlunatus sp. Gsoil 973]